MIKKSLLGGAKPRTWHFWLLDGEEFKKDIINGKSESAIKATSIKDAMDKLTTQLNTKLSAAEQATGKPVGLSLPVKKKNQLSSVYILQYKDQVVHRVSREGKEIEPHKNVAEEQIATVLDKMYHPDKEVKRVVTAVAESRSNIHDATAKIEENPTVSVLTTAANDTVLATEKSIEAIRSVQLGPNHAAKSTATLNQQLSLLKDKTKELKVKPNDPIVKDDVVKTIQEIDSTLSEQAQAMEKGGIDFIGFYMDENEKQWRELNTEIWGSDSMQAAQDLYQQLIDTGVEPVSIAIAYRTKDRSVSVSIWDIVTDNTTDIEYLAPVIRDKIIEKD
ncbi:MAG TPA: hypothetical protein VNX68_10960, partial [Nitrosopumilaceae archaeon]|nr:hypothetical protein [Nitrosopumilaceae archaeon]